MLILRAEMFNVGPNVNVEKVKLRWCSTLCPPLPAPTPANQIVSNQTYQITLGTLFYLCDPCPAVSGGTMVTAAAGHGISLATEESKYKKIK